MGLFNNLAGAISSFKEGYSGVSDDTKMFLWNIPEPMHEVIVSGDHERTIYTYSSEPLRKIRKGQIVTVEAFRGDAVMTSTETGTRWDTRTDGDTVILYNGIPFGFSSIPKEKVMEAAKLGYALKFKSKCYGMLEGYKGVKEMRLIAPQRIFLKDWIPSAPEDRPISMRENGFVYNEYDPDDFKAISVRDSWFFADATLAIIPTPKGSKAKPHIGVFANDGTQISEVAAINQYYNKLLDFMQRYTKYNVSAYRCALNDGRAYYHIEIEGF
jgi:hypothetical protein